MSRVPDSVAEAAADSLVGPPVDSPVSLAYSEGITCRCGCGSRQTPFNMALDYFALGMSARNAVETVAVHFGLSEAEQEQLVDDVEADR